MQKPWRRNPEKAYKERDAKVTSKVMSKIKSKNNKSETSLRKEIWKRGWRYRLYDKSLAGRPDLVFKSEKVIIFVDGDFWHGRALIEEGIEGLKRGLRTSRSDWWIAKIARNVERDIITTKQLELEGWRVLRIWESEIVENVSLTADRVEIFLNQD